MGLRTLVERVTGVWAPPPAPESWQRAAYQRSNAVWEQLASIKEAREMRPTTPADGFLCPALTRVNGEREPCLDPLPCSAHRIDTPGLGSLMWGSIYRKVPAHAR